MLRALVAAFAVAGTTAIAQVSSVVSDRQQSARGDPEQIVCISETVTGTRLSSRRVCRTRAEWEQHKEQTRRVVERVQFYKPTCGDGGSGCNLDPRMGGN
jgi:hypothetical protein